MDINPLDVLVYLGIFTIWAVLCGFLYSKIHCYRANRGAYDRPLNQWYSRSQIKTTIKFLEKEILSLKTTVDNFVKTGLKDEIKAVMDAHPPPSIPPIPSVQEIIDGVEIVLPTVPTAREIIDGVKREIPTVPNTEDIADSVSKSVRASLGGMKKAANAEEKEIMADVAEIQVVEYPNLLWVAENIDTLVDAEIIGQAWVDKFHRLTKIPFALPFMEKASGKVREMFDQGSMGGIGKSRRANYV